ncbi:MAG: hypothetical protein HY873_01115, partial [Chloroflexi bacterium]|nr:hypothetical protein [Chloroflexota bacterium]
EAYIVAIFCALFAVVLLELRVFTKHIRPANHAYDDDLGRGDPEDNARERE